MIPYSFAGSLSPFSPDLSKMNMISIKCDRCATNGLQCCIDYLSPSPGVKSICRECQLAGNVNCIFPPSIRLVVPQSNTACTLCREHHQKCVFFHETDIQCTRCSKRNLSCMFKLNGKSDILSLQHIFIDCILM